MTTLTETTQSASLRNWGLAGKWQDLQARFTRWRLYRQTLGEMASLSNRELADLGLHRSELKRVALMAVYES
ncbi:DUF1127 domain-containing protein [Aestuariivita boseongensis]|uniref:DUF1127 domain-containing protein n=1 Tax=Aestuariivita boseongensis TaxID=1470562 RepID=UPI00067FE4C4|nr:DUF1127 domain-containing protein [Aestuariivita boseongensis]